MKVIDLLNKIANGIDIPLQIKYDNDIWKYDEMARDYLLIDKSGEEYLICEELNLMYALNEEVEIIEEDKKIERLNNTIDKLEKGVSEAIKQLELLKYIDKYKFTYNREFQKAIDILQELKGSE